MCPTKPLCQPQYAHERVLTNLGCEPILEDQQVINQKNQEMINCFKNTHLVRITADTCHSLQPKIKGRELIFTLGITICEAGGFEEGDDETAQAAVNVQPEPIFFCERRKTGNIVLGSIRVIDGRSHKLQEKEREGGGCVSSCLGSSSEVSLPG